MLDVRKNQLHQERNVMDIFLHKVAPYVTGVLSGFDRIVFRGTLRRLFFVEGIMCYLSAKKVLLKDFGSHVAKVSGRIKDASKDLAARTSRPYLYLPSSSTSKEQTAREVAVKEKIREGLVCILRSVEPCLSWDLYRNSDTKRLEPVIRHRKCLHLYHYYLDPVFGFMNARIQTWFPFNIQICVNGRMWLSRQMDEVGIAYQQSDNCFLWIQDPAKAQELMDSQIKTNWPETFQGIVHRLNPHYDDILRGFPAHYYWSVFQSEWATDIMFRSAKDLARLYPTLIHHAMTTFSSPDVMRFLGRKIDPSGKIPSQFAGQVVTSLKQRPEGVRVKHRVKSNSLKMYDKDGSVLRTETTINDPSDFKVYRSKESQPDSTPDWRSLRKGIADLHRRAQVSQACNNRYLENLADAQDKTPLKHWTDKLCRPVIWKGKRARALNPYAPDDAELLQAIARGELKINGFTNKQLRSILYSRPPSSEADRKRQSSQTTRRIRLLRAHGLVTKLPKSHRYQLTKRGSKAVTALICARNSDADSLAKLAA